MRYNPKDAIVVIPEGEYEASISNVNGLAKDGGPLTTKNGDPMEQVTFDVYVGDVVRKHSEYFVSSPKALWRYKRLAQALGVADQFKAGDFEASNYIGSNLRLGITIEDDAAYGERNRVEAFNPSDVAASIPPPPPAPKPPAGFVQGARVAMNRPVSAAPSVGEQPGAPLNDGDIPF